MRPVLFQNPERKQACALGLLEALPEISGGKLLPLGRKLGLCGKSRGRQKTGGNNPHGSANHDLWPPDSRRILTPRHQIRAMQSMLYAQQDANKWAILALTQFGVKADIHRQKQLGIGPPYGTAEIHHKTL